MSASVALAAFIGAVGIVAGVAAASLDPLLRRRPAVAVRLPPGRLPNGVVAAAGIAAGVLSAALAARTGPTAGLVPLVAVVVAGTYLSALDLRHRLLPNVVVVPMIGVAAVLLVGAGAAEGRPGDGLRALLGGLVLFVVYLVLALISPGGLGMGDVKFAALIGGVLAYRGWEALLLGAAAGFGLVALVGGALLVLRRAGRGSTVPFGPMMLLGAVAVLVSVL